MDLFTSMLSANTQSRPDTEMVAAGRELATEVHGLFMKAKSAIKPYLHAIMSTPYSTR